MFGIFKKMKETWDARTQDDLDLEIWDQREKIAEALKLDPMLQPDPVLFLHGVICGDMRPWLASRKIKPALDVSTIIMIAKAVCAVCQALCPIINGLAQRP